jgi:dTDP-glucose 4,6-dehydratase
MQKILYITGCLGFIGSYVTKLFLEKGYYVRGIDKITYAANIDLLAEFTQYPTFVFEHKDINDIEFLYDCDYIINIAAETHVGNSIVKSDDFIKSNIGGVQNLLELLRNYRQENRHTPRLIHFSTDEVYGDILKGKHVETDTLKPSNPYSATKAAADMLIQAWSRTYNIEYTIVRPTNNYGIGQYVEKLIPKTCKFLLLDRKIPLHNNGTPIRNWLHVEDTANSINVIIDNHNITKNEIYNICGSFEQNNISTVEKIIKTYLNKDDINLNDYVDLSYNRDGQDLRYALNDDKLKRLGWKSTHSFDSDIIDIIKYYKHKFIW